MIEGVILNLFQDLSDKQTDKYWIGYNTMLLKQGYVYILSNIYRTTFYIGVTADLNNRLWQHLNGEGSAFVKKYNCYDLVYYEMVPGISEAIKREKQLKRWHREWKINLIKSLNPDMKDLKGELQGE